MAFTLESETFLSMGKSRVLEYINLRRAWGLRCAHTELKVSELVIRVVVVHPRSGRVLLVRKSSAEIGNPSLSSTSSSGYGSGSSGNSTLISTPLSSTPSPIGSRSVSPSNSNPNEEAFEIPTFRIGDVYIIREDGEEEEEILLVAISRILKSDVGVTMKRLVKELGSRDGFRKIEEMGDPLGLGFWQWRSETRRAVELGLVVECEEEMEVQSGLGAKRIWVDRGVLGDGCGNVGLVEGVREVLGEVWGVEVEEGD